MIIYLEGNIGSGKSTLINFLQEYISKHKIDADVILEPVDEWEQTQDSQGKNILQHYYQDAKKYGFPFQINALLSRVKKITETIQNSKKTVHFVERSIFTDKNVFLETNYQNGNITEIEYVIYQQWFQWIVDNYRLQPDGIAFLNTNTSVCYERIKERSRCGEEAIPLEYLNILDSFHRKWLDNESSIPIIHLDTNENFYENPTKKEIEIGKIMSLIDRINQEKIRFC